MNSFRRSMGMLGGCVAMVIACATGCASSESAADEGGNAAISKGDLTSFKNPVMTKVKKEFDALTKSDDYHARTRGFPWGGGGWKVGSKLETDGLVYMFSNENRVAANLQDDIGISTDYRYDTLRTTEGVAVEKFHVPARLAGTLDKDLAALVEAGVIVTLYVPKVELPETAPTAGMMVLIDYENDEALFLYGRAGVAPLTVDCTATEMHSSEFNWGFSIAPASQGGEASSANVHLAVVALTGDTVLSVGSAERFSNIASTEQKRGYKVDLMQTGDKIIADAGTADTFPAKLIVDGKAGTLYGDKNNTHSPVKAATLACK